MTQYIDKSALVAEIENLLDKGKYHEEYDCAYRDGNNGALHALKGKLDTLEVKEVDLEKETTHYLLYEHCSPLNEIMHKADLKSEMQYHKDIENAFKAGFELGLKAQIMTSKLQQRISVLKMEFWTGLQTFEETEMTLSDAYNQGVDDILEELGLKVKKGE